MRSFFYTLIFALFLAATVNATEAEIPVDSVTDLFGAWQVVALDPKTQDDPLQRNHAYFIFLPSMSVVEVNIPTEQTQESSSSVTPFSFKDSVVWLTHGPNDIEPHKVSFVGKKLKFEVPFGAIFFQRTPNH